MGEPNEYQRRTAAKGHLRWEVRMLTEQATLLGEWGADPRDAQWDALLHAALVHLRVIDGFLLNKDPRWKDDVLARHFSDNWPKGHDCVLTQEQRDDVNGQLFHLAARRKATSGWHEILPVLTTKACQAFRRFVEGVQPRWQTSFRDADRFAFTWLANNAAGTDHR